MTHPRTTPQAAKPGLSRLRPVVSCVVRAAALVVLACFASLLVPMCHDSSSCLVMAHTSQAFADDGEIPPLPEPPTPTGPALSYINLMANQAQMDPSQFVATTVCALGVTTGMQMTLTESVNLIDGNLYDNLDNLIDAADYPAWDSLSYSEQQEYQNKQNYDASKYVSLMDAFDMGSGFQRYNDSLSSGGANFQFTDGEKGNLAKIARIGQNWANGIGQTLQSVKNCLAPDYSELLYKWMYGSNTSEEGEKLYNGAFPDTWLEGEYVYYNQTNIGWVKYGTGGNNVIKVQSLGDVYLIMRKVNNDNSLSSFNLFSKAPFQWGMNYSIQDDANLNASSKKYVSSSGNEFYYSDTNLSVNNVFQSSQAISKFSRDSNETKLRFIEEQILFGDAGGGGSAPGELEPDIPSYPSEQVPDSTIVYYPVGGITPTTTWNQYTTVQRPENPYNPDNQTSTPEWKQETKQNIQGLQGVHFEKLFPFSMLFSIPQLVNVVQNGVASNEGVPKTQISIPLRWSVTGSSAIVLDLTDLANLLVMVRPFNRVLLVFSLLLALVMFWKSILTGD